ncbi:NAD(P)-binding domain-containing protein, partial [Klebsiella pneumoniae]|uniref:NAD(P)-binding domain-containing protein n=1 Tax=Klebsiella pneumoniae TaxID=573 RepID=UPI0039C16A73
MTQRIAFLGLGTMGGPMAVNLAKAGYAVNAFDLSAEACAKAAEQPGVRIAASAAAAID